MLSVRRRDQGLALVLRAAAALMVVVLVGMLALLVREAWPAIGGGHVDLWGRSWQPSAGEYGLAPLLVGSLLVTAGALALAAPVALGVALFIDEVGPRWLAGVMRRGMAILTATPSVVIGVWGLTAVVPRLGRWHAPGPSLAAGCIVLAMMIVPTVAVLIERGLAAVPRERRLAAAALGLSRGTLIRDVLLPAVRPAVANALAIGAARALGETMVVMMVTGNVPQLPGGPFVPVRTVTANLALEMPYAAGTHRAALFAAALVLTLLVAALLALAFALRPRGAAT